MKTLLLNAAQMGAAEIAASLIRAGELVALPTETVYGLGADGLNPEAVAKIFKAKGRPQDNPLILHLAHPAQIDDYCHSIPDDARRLAAQFWPGPLTMVLPAKPIVPACTTAGLPTVAVRCPAPEITRKIISLSGCPIAAPSANLSGKPSTTTAAHVLDDYGSDGALAAIVDGGPCGVGVESTIVDLSGQEPALLRPGGIGPEQLRAVLGRLQIDPAVTGALAPDQRPKAPGMKYRHYAPDAQVIIVLGGADAVQRYIDEHFAPGDAVLCFDEELPRYAAYPAYAYGRGDDALSLCRGLFAALRRLDHKGYGTVWARCPDGGGAAWAVQNRLKKAAGFRIVEVE